MSKKGTPLKSDISDSGFDKYLTRPFEGLGEANREFQEQTGYSYADLVAGLEGAKIQGFTTTIAFTSTDYRVVTWAAGTISYQDGLVTPEIATTNTGNMAARTYIYYDPQASKVALNTTTTAATATQGERLLLAIATPNANTSGMASVEAFGSTGTYIANLSVEHLTAGSIRSKTVTLAVTAGTGDCYFNAGKTDFTNTQSGFILGIDDSDSDKAKFYIGDSSEYLNWDGSNLTVAGTMTIGSASTIDGLLASSVSGWAHGSDTTKIDGGDVYTNTITATQISVAQLDAINANTGTLTVDESISSGQTAYNTGTGFWMEYNSGTPRFSIGKATEARMLWTGTALEVYNDSNAKVIDSKGLIGSASFTSDMTYLTGANLDVSGDHQWAEMGFDYTFTLTRATPYLFFGAVGYACSGSDDDATARIKVGASTYYPDSYGWEQEHYQPDSASTQSFTFLYLITIPSGTDVPVDLEVAGKTGDETITVTKGNHPRSFLGYIKLGT